MAPLNNSRNADKNLQVIVLDDEESVLSSIKHLFRREQFDFRFFTSPQTALEAFGAYSAAASPDFHATVDELTDVAVKRGMISKEIASRWPGLQNRYVPYVASLLQDIGLLARVCVKPVEYRSFVKLRNSAGLSPGEAEEIIFGKNRHEKIGAAILDHWSFHHDVVATVGKHHTETVDDDNVTIVQVASLLERRTDPYDSAVGKLAEEWRGRLSIPKESASKGEGTVS